MPAATDLLNSLPIPAEIVTFYSDALPDSAGLLPQEEPATVGMVAQRLAEFTHGRYCARAAMAKLGATPGPILKGDKREPLWPAGVVGSISHTGPVAAAAVARPAAVRSVGLDMETADPLADKLLDLICLPHENPTRDGRRAKLLFSVKEAIYKCLYPLTHEYIDFLEMEVQLVPDSQRFCARSHSDKCSQGLAADINGAYTEENGLVASIAWLTATNSLRD